MDLAIERVPSHQVNRFGCHLWHFYMISLYYGLENGLKCFKKKMRVAELLKKLSNHHLALICINLVVNVVIWEGEHDRFVTGGLPPFEVENDESEMKTFFSNLSSFCQELLRTMKKHLDVMIRNNGMIECNELLLDYFKFDYKRIDGHLFKNTFNFRLRDSYPYTLNDILADF